MTSDLRSTLGGRVRVVLAQSAVNIFAAEIGTLIIVHGPFRILDRLGAHWSWAALVGLATGIVAGLLPSDGPETTPFVSGFKTQLPFALLISGLMTPTSGVLGAFAVMLPVAALIATGLAFTRMRARPRSTRGAA